MELKRREDIAVMAPTVEHLQDYLTMWQWTQQKGATFADIWRRVVWQSPELDYAQRRPANNAALKVHASARDGDEAQQLRLLARDHGLIFFFKSDCPYCHAMAPTVKLLAAKYGIEVYPVSLDAKGLPDFPAPRDGRVQAAQWGVSRVPALFIASKLTGEHVAIGFGVMSLSEIVQRMFVLTATEPGERF